MSKQQLTWMLGLIAAWRQFSDDDGDNGPTGLPVTDVWAMAGFLSNAKGKSANDNDLMSRLVAFLWLLCANTCANLISFGVVLCKITRPPMARPDGPLTRMVAADSAILVLVFGYAKTITSPHQRSGWPCG